MLTTSSERLAEAATLAPTVAPAAGAAAVGPPVAQPAAAQQPSVAPEAQPHRAVRVTTEPLLCQQRLSESLTSSGEQNTALTEYPNWETWRFRRTLSYWISVMYLEGSILFTIGAGFSFFSKYNSTPMSLSLARATVSAPKLAELNQYVKVRWSRYGERERERDVV